MAAFYRRTRTRYHRQMRTERVDQYWSTRFGLKRSDLYREGINVVPHAQLWQNNFAYVFVRNTTCILSVGLAVVGETRERVRSLGEANTFLQALTLRSVFARPIHHTVGQAYQGFTEKEGFLPRVSGSVRQLAADELHMLERLKSGSEPTAWLHR